MPMPVDWIHAAISGVYISTWIVIANISINRRAQRSDDSG